MMNLGKSLKAALKLKGKSQSQFARENGMHLRTVHRMANTVCGTVDNFNSLSAIFGMTASEFVKLGEDRTKEDYESWCNARDKRMNFEKEESGEYADIITSTGFEIYIGVERVTDQMFMDKLPARGAVKKDGMDDIVLECLSLSGFAPAYVIGLRTGLSAGDAEASLESLRSKGLVINGPGRNPCWMVCDDAS